VLECWDGQSNVLVLSFGVGFEGTSSCSVGLVTFRLLSLSQVAQYVEQVFGVDFQLGKIQLRKIQRFQFTCRDVWSIRYEALVGWFSMPS